MQQMLALPMESLVVGVCGRVEWGEACKNAHALTLWFLLGRNGEY